MLSLNFSLFSPYFLKEKTLKMYVPVCQKEALVLPEVCFDLNRNFWNSFLIYTHSIFH